MEFVFGIDQYFKVHRENERACGKDKDKGIFNPLHGV